MLHFSNFMTGNKLALRSLADTILVPCNLHITFNHMSSAKGAKL